MSCTPVALLITLFPNEDILKSCCELELGASEWQLIDCIHHMHSSIFEQPTFVLGNTIYTHMLQGKSSSGPVMELSPGSSSLFSQSHSSDTTQKPGTTSMIVDSCEPNQNFSSPGSIEVSSDIFITNNGMDRLDGTDAQTLRQLEEQLSLNEDSFKEISPFDDQNEISHDLSLHQDQRVIYKQDQSAAFSGPDEHGPPYDGYKGIQGNLNKLEHLRKHTSVLE